MQQYVVEQFVQFGFDGFGKDAGVLCCHFSFLSFSLPRVSVLRGQVFYCRLLWLLVPTLRVGMQTDASIPLLASYQYLVSVWVPTEDRGSQECYGTCSASL
jgi:hypothetical protein